MYAHMIEESIGRAVNTFATQMGWINELPRVHSIIPAGEDSLIEMSGDEEVLRLVSASIGRYTFDFLAIVRGPSECILYMDARTSNLVMDLKIVDLERTIMQRLKEHLTIYPHNMGM